MAPSISSTKTDDSACATAGLASGIIVCPLDVIKTKLQAQGGFSGIADRATMGERVLAYRGLAGTARTIWTEEGVRGMYRGLGPLVLGYLPTWTVYFTVYEKSKDVIADQFGGKSWFTHTLSAMVAGTSSTLVTNPIWVIKTRLMSQNANAANASSQFSPISNTSSAYIKVPYHYTSTLDAARKMYLHEGIWSFYSGLAPALLGLSHVAVQFPLYEAFKGFFIGEEAEKSTNSFTHFWGVLAASCLSKICASSATYPHEVLRTRLQTQKITHSDGDTRPRYRGIIHSAGTVYREEGWRAFYAGMGTNMLRAVPASAMTLITYESQLSLLVSCSLNCKLTT
ncbi:mitochondrial carrier [Choiromyces venosus 120613-1]|uniref:Mitochondrial carrier n=1 Tax=Choiromyces venosus 120613-1 TaxID=1336337 RepID=A0A3N4K3B7_9PEZI|nr:mitochondrial carrier [Choiromyces venosus 120613-1]